MQKHCKKTVETGICDAIKCTYKYFLQYFSILDQGDRNQAYNMLVKVDLTGKS